MATRHGVSPHEANEARTDPARLVLVPDPARLSGRGIRTIGWSETRGTLLTVITLESDDTELFGVNSWEANALDQRKHNERKADA